MKDINQSDLQFYIKKNKKVHIKWDEEFCGFFDCL